MPMLLGKNEYKLCYLDTNIVSAIVKNNDQEALNYLKIFTPNKYVTCLSVYNLIEIMRKTVVFDEFKRLFSKLPFLILKSPPQLLIDEYDYIKNKKKVIPIFIAFSNIDKSGSTPYSL